MIVLALTAAMVDSARLDSVLQDAGGNRPVLEQCLEGAEKMGMADEARWLILNMPHLDRLEMDTATFFGHLRGAKAFKNTLPDSIFRDYLLAYRILEEPCENWRPVLQKRFEEVRSPTELRDWIAENIELDTNRYFFGPFPGPLSTLGSGSGSNTARCVLLVAGLRSLGIAARLAKCPYPRRTWVEFYDSGHWKPLFFEKPEPGVVLVQHGFGWVQATKRYWPVGYLDLSFTTDGQRDTLFQDFSVQIWANWRYESLDDLYWPNEQAGDSDKIMLPPGQYTLVWARRNPDGEPFVRTKQFKIQANKTTELELETQIPAQAISQGDLMVRRLDSLPILVMSDQTPVQPKKLPCALVFLDESEASLRTLKQVKAFENLDVLEVRTYPGPQPHIDPQELKKTLGIKRLPSVIVLDSQGKPVLWTEGFKPGLESYLKVVLKQR